MTDGYTDVPDESEQLDQIPAEESLTDRGVEDPLDEGVITPDDWSPAMGYGTTADEQSEGETLAQRVKQEVPDDWQDEATPEELDDLAAESLDDGEVGDRRAGRLVDPGTDDGGLDVESELLGEDVGIDGAAASAEEAAVHVIEDERF